MAFPRVSASRLLVTRARLAPRPIRRRAGAL